MILNGILDWVGESRQITNDKGTYKFVPIVIKTTEQYSNSYGEVATREQMFCVDVAGNAAKEFSLPVGCKVSAIVDFRVQEYNNKMFQKAMCYKINMV